MVGKAKKEKQTSNAAARAVATINNEIHDELNSTASTPARNKSSSPALDSATSHSHVTPQDSNSKDKTTASPWYGGSWREKSSPVAAIARESICVSGGATTETPNKDAPATKRPATYMNSRLKSSTKGVPIIAEPTKVNAKGTNDNNTNDDRPLDQPSSPTVNKDAADEKHDLLDTVDKNPPTQAQGAWFGWWSRPDGYANSHPDPHRTSQPENPAPVPTTKGAPQPMPTESHARSALPEPADEAQHNSPKTDRPSTRVDDETRARDTPSRSWFGLWSASQNQEAQGQTAPTVPATVDRANAAPNEPSSSSVAADVTERSKTPTITQRQQDTQRKKPDDTKHASMSLSGTPARQSTGWAFWSSDQGETAPKPADGPQKRTGELAVADTPSQSHPEAAQFNQNGRAKSVKQNSSANTKSPRRQSLVDPPSDLTALNPPANTKERPKSEAARLAAATQALHAKLRGPPNHIFPAFSTTYPPAYNPSYLERIGQYLVSSLRFPNAVIATPNHVCLAPAAPKIKTAIAIGVHGYFPAAIIQKVLGQPTGTSIRFANYAADSIRWWTEQHQPDVTCEIDQIALEGEGLIADRVDTLWKLLLNWLSHLRKADLILVACHSQGVPVSVMLIAKLIELGCLGNNVKIGICAMAGVNLGPFIDFKSKFFGGSAAELFEFASPNSAVSREYASSLDVILRHGVRLTYVGSLDDQLVSLESSLFINLSHPYVQRAVFIDGRLHAPDFISRLVAFALKLRNLGISDHGLIRELSTPLAGSIYGGEGHSRLYDDQELYRLALAFTLNTTDIDPKTYVSTSGATTTETDTLERRRSSAGIPSSTTVANRIRRGTTSASQRPGVAPAIAPYETVSAANANPYILPWALRGILEEPAVKTDMQDEVRGLIKMFDEWRPVTKMLKDVRFRLEAVKSAALGE